MAKFRLSSTLRRIVKSMEAYQLSIAQYCMLEVVVEAACPIGLLVADGDEFGLMGGGLGMSDSAVTKTLLELAGEGLLIVSSGDFAHCIGQSELQALNRQELTREHDYRY